MKGFYINESAISIGIFRKGLGKGNDPKLEVLTRHGLHNHLDFS